MHQLLEDIFSTNHYTNRRGEKVRVWGYTIRPQCDFLQNIIRDNNFKNTLEIGFSYGVSTLAILEEINKVCGTHCVIDIFENTLFKGRGLELVDLAGYTNSMEFHEKYCYEVLPKLMFEKRKFDFAYIDSTKQFDWILLDFFYIDKLLNIGGVIAFDDVDWPGIRKLLRYISRFPNYKIYGTWPENSKFSISKKLSLFMSIKKIKRLIRNNLIITDSDLGINTHCVALQKIDEDKRNWDWHIDF
jgi:predicted O-methyltransferase YrrM